MKIYVKLIDASNDKILNDKFVVLLDESSKHVKERLFMYNSNSANKYYPNFVKLIRKKGENDIDDNTLILKNQFLTSYTIKDEDKIIYVSSILDTLENDIKKTTSITQLYTYYKNNNDNFITEYNKIIKTYNDLTQDDFVGAISIILYDKYEKLVPEYNDFLKEIKTVYNNIIKKYQPIEESLDEFYQSCKKNDLKEYYSENVPTIIVKDITIQFKHHDFVTGTKGRFVKLQNIFNQFALSENVPMIAISNEKENPIIKVYDNISNYVSTKEFRSWVLHDKKEKVIFGKKDEEGKRIVSYKKIKGLLLKIKHTSQKTDYITMNIYDNGIIECRIKFNDSSENNDNLDVIVTELRNSIENCIHDINTLNGIYTKSKRLDISEKECDVIFDSITCSVELNKKIDLDNVINTVIDDYFQENIFQLKEGKSKDVISLYYKKFLRTDETSSLGRFKLLSNLELPQTERKGITVNIQDNPYSIGSILNIYSASDINEIYLIVDQIAYIDKLIVETEETRKQKIKEKSNIKNLRNEYNIPILSTSCQKQRQPIIDDNQEPLSGMIDKKTKKPLVDSYPLIYNGIRLICPNEEYPYPGFTQKNAICCFTKDQRKNTKYISNMGLEEVQKDGVKKQINKYILTTDKILEYNKIGTLLSIFDDVFNKLPSNIKDIKNGKFYRIGVNQNNNAFLNAISLGIHNKEINIDIFKKNLVTKLKNNPNLFYKLNNGQIKSKYKDLNNYIHWITDNNNIMNVNDLIELLQKMYNINIIIFNIPMIYSKSTAKVNEEMIKIHCHINCKPEIDKPYIVIFKREKKYELLIYYNDLKTKYNFNVNDSQVFNMINDFYSKTCIKEEVYPKKYNQYNYDRLYNGNDVITSLKGTPHEITGQVSKKNKKIVLLITNDNVLIPIIESTLFISSEKDNNIEKELPIYYDPPLIDGNEYLRKLKDINTIFKKNKLAEMNIIGITNKNDGLVTNLSGFIIPILKTENTNLQKVNYNYYPINSGIEISENKRNQQINDVIEYNVNYNKVQNEIYNIKQTLSNIIYHSKKLTNYIYDIQKSAEYFNLSRFKMIQLYNDIFNKIIDIMKVKHDVHIDNNTLYLSIISNDIIDDNKENLFFKGIVQKPEYDINEIKLYSNESIVYNMKDFYNYINTHFDHNFED